MNEMRESTEILVYVVVSSPQIEVVIRTNVIEKTFICLAILRTAVFFYVFSVLKSSPEKILLLLLSFNLRRNIRQQANAE